MTFGSESETTGPGGDSTDADASGGPASDVGDCVVSALVTGGDSLDGLYMAALERIALKRRAAHKS